MKENTEIQIIEHLRARIPKLLGIYIFGSYADNTATKNSDIDIAFLSFEKITPVEKWRIQEELASILDINIDLVDLKDATVVLRAEVVEKGKLIYSSDQYQVDYFEMTTYSMYADFNETRAEILNDYKEKYGRDSHK
ncbi:type II toxin-antitoxin system antitoxin [Draconibacterium sp.]